MAERLEFREKLSGILTLCESQNNITDKATVEAYFAEDNLSAEQMELVFDYLLSKKVIVKGYVKAGGSIKNAENTEGPIRYTQEEQDYLNLYEQDLKALYASGLVDRVADDLFLLLDANTYSETTGLDVRAEGGKGVFL